jgi:hypothetical protein
MLFLALLFLLVLFNLPYFSCSAVPDRPIVCLSSALSLRLPGPCVGDVQMKE